MGPFPRVVLFAGGVGLSGCPGVYLGWWPVVSGGPGGVLGEGGFTSAFAWFLADIAWV